MTRSERRTAVGCIGACAFRYVYVYVYVYMYVYVCRLGNDQGRSVSAWGFWGDILNSPYHSFGTACDEKSLFKISNKQHTHTALDVAEYNVKVQHQQ